jgi:vancomycin resistance protein YoaR
MPRARRRVAVIAVAVPILLLVSAVAVWAVDTRADDHVVRNVRLAGRPVGGLSEAALERKVERIAAQYEAMPVEIEVGDRTLETTVGDLGARVDQEATVASAMDIGRAESWPGRPVAYYQRMFDEEIAPVHFASEPNTVEETLVTLQGEDRVAPVEPSIEVAEGTYRAVPGENGQGIAPEDILDELNRVGQTTTGREDALVLRVENREIPPRFPDEDAEELAVQANEITDEPLTVTAGGQSVDVAPEQLKTWITSKAGAARLKLTVDQELIETDLPELLPDFGEPPVNASFTVGAFGPEVVPGRNGTGCCAPNSGQRVADTLIAGETQVQLELGPREPDLTTEEAEGLGIIEEIGIPDEEPCNSGNAAGCHRTTHHSCCESRVTNIHRMADLVRGYVIMPNGGQFSINDHVGERTAENGFVLAGAIEQGRHVEHIGGGVSQFATTMFNAAFHAGLDIPAYQMHTEHLSRYPFGRESTVSYPQPDFIIENNTPYGVLIWPTYDDTSITVHLYSTRWVEGRQTGQSTSSRGNCIDVVTTRTRTYLEDGHTENDTFSGYYRQGTTTC